MFDNESFLSLKIEAQCKPRSRMPQSAATVGHQHKLPYHINDSRKHKTEVGKGGVPNAECGMRNAERQKQGVEWKRAGRAGKRQKAKVVKAI
jgi:hypothetical protein